MDELELLKRDWKQQDAHLPKVSFDQIHTMIHQKSSSIVKWILIICIAELLFWTGLNFLIPDKYLEIYQVYHLKTFLFIVQLIHVTVVVVFIYFFYKNYKAISVIDSASGLIQKIIKTRKTVNYYVYYNIISYMLFSIVVNYILFSNPDNLISLYNSGDNHVDNERFLQIMFITQIISLLVFIGLLCLYYRIIYGILLKKLSKNHKELEYLE